MGEKKVIDIQFGRESRLGEKAEQWFEKNVLEKLIFKLEKSTILKVFRSRQLAVNFKSIFLLFTKDGNLHFEDRLRKTLKTILDDDKAFRLLFAEARDATVYDVKDEFSAHQEMKNALEEAFDATQAVKQP
jgi:hypothetical protein